MNAAVGADLARRDVLKLGALAGASLALSGCERLVSYATDEIPDAFSVATTAEIDPDFHLLQRATFGPRPGDLDRLRTLGRAAWIEQQLDPASIDDTSCDLRARRFESIHADARMGYEFKKEVLRSELVRHTVLRATYSERALFEVMVEFWTDHLNIDLAKGDCIYLKPADDREVIRAHALGSFRDLIRASATSPAMLVYLDGTDNKKRNPMEQPNENYGRELLELHTLGVEGGYTQADVAEVARCLTGWSVKQSGWGRGGVSFNPAHHDDGAKEVLGHAIPAGGGAADLERVVEIACGHPSTARHVARKLVRRFVAEDPPTSLVTRIAATFTRTAGSISACVREILTSDEFGASRGTKLKRPLRLVTSALRALGADTHAHRSLTNALESMGQEPFSFPTPDGYPDERAPWFGGLLWRWNVALALGANTMGRVSFPADELARGLGHPSLAAAPIDALFAHVAGRTPTAVERAALESVRAAYPGQAGPLVGLLLAQPAFQLH